MGDETAHPRGGKALAFKPSPTRDQVLPFQLNTVLCWTVLCLAGCVHAPA
jgi:hypothetical protein